MCLLTLHSWISLRLAGFAPESRPSAWQPFPLPALGAQSCARPWQAQRLHGGRAVGAPVLGPVLDTGAVRTAPTRGWWWGGQLSAWWSCWPGPVWWAPKGGGLGYLPAHGPGGASSGFSLRFPGIWWDQFFPSLGVWVSGNPACFPSHLSCSCPWARPPRVWRLRSHRVGCSLWCC